MLQFSQLHCLRRVLPRTVPLGWLWWLLFNDVSNLQAWLPHRPFLQKPARLLVRGQRGILQETLEFFWAIVTSSS